MGCVAGVAGVAGAAVPCEADADGGTGWGGGGSAVPTATSGSGAGARGLGRNASHMTNRTSNTPAAAIIPVRRRSMRRNMLKRRAAPLALGSVRLYDCGLLMFGS